MNSIRCKRNAKENLMPMEVAMERKRPLRKIISDSNPNRLRSQSEVILSPSLQRQKRKIEIHDCEVLNNRITCLEQEKAELISALKASEELVESLQTAIEKLKKDVVSNNQQASESRRKKRRSSEIGVALGCLLGVPTF